MTTWQIWLLKGVAALAVLAAIVAGTWFKADAYYSAKYDNLKGQLVAEAKDQQKQVDATIANNTMVAKEINDEAVNQIGLMSDVISDLSVRLNTSRRPFTVCPATAGTPAIGAAPNGSGTTATAGRDPVPSTGIVVDRQVLTDILQAADDAVTADILWRKYARETGQSAP